MRRRVFLASVATVGATGCLHGPEEEGRIEEEGEMEVVIDGDTIDLTQERLQAENAENASLAFHFHEGDGKWYMEGERVTFAKGIDLLPYFAYERSDAGDALTYDGTTYDENDEGTELIFTVDGEVVEPTEYELQNDETLRVEVVTDDA